MSASLSNSHGIANFHEVENKYDQKHCAICIENFTHDSRVINIKCNHIFHSQCFENWLNSSSPNRNTCPICFQAVVILNRVDRTSSKCLETVKVFAALILSAFFLPFAVLHTIHTYNVSYN
ncbi:MAG: RING finger domain-containing protein [Waddliaceae bacterium]